MMKKMVIALTLIAMSGCASIVNDKNQKVIISASNGQAIKGTVQDVTTSTVKVDGKTQKKTDQVVSASFEGKPADILLERSNAKKVAVVENAECEKQTPIKNSVSPMFFGNILIGGLIGSTIDSATGKMWQYEDKVVIKCQQDVI